MRRPPGALPAFALLVGLLALAGARPRPALAADEIEALAKRHFTRGKQLYDERKYREAAGEFEAGYAVAPRAGFLLNIAHSYRRAGDLRKARRYYELYLEKDPGSAQRGEVQGYVKTIDDALADQTDQQGYSQEATGAENGKTANGARPPAAPAPAAVTAPEGATLGPLPAEACAEREPAREGRPIWPWLVSGAALVIAGGIVAAVLIAGPGKSDPCGSLGCLNER